MTPTGKTRLAFIIGHPIEQVKSPSGVSAIMAANGEDVLVLPAHVLPEDFHAFLPAIKTLQNACGFIFTVPYKIEAMRHCDQLTDRARAVGAVNVLLKSPQGWIGDNLDGLAFVDALLRKDINLKGKSALMIGAGGAAAAIGHALLESGLGRLAIRDLDQEKAEMLSRRLSRQFSALIETNVISPAGFDLVINASTAGMETGQQPPVDTENLEGEQIVCDVVTLPEITQLLQDARYRGCRISTGVEMFESQSHLLAASLTGKGEPSALDAVSHKNKTIKLE